MKMVDKYTLSEINREGKIVKERNGWIILKIEVTPYEHR
jgi:hypothetical protein